MAARPKLSLDSFLKHVFSPSKNPLPTGLRKKTLSGLKGRKRARLTAYNKMPAKNQRILDETGSRDAYLRGDMSLADARRMLREKAVSKGFVKPLRSRGPQGKKQTPLNPMHQVDGWQVFHHLSNLNESEKLDRQAVAAFVNLMSDEQRRRALSFTSFTDILAAGTSKPPDARTINILGTSHYPEDIAWIDGDAYNVFWYHSGGR